MREILDNGGLYDLSARVDGKLYLAVHSHAGKGSAQVFLTTAEADALARRLDHYVTKANRKERQQ